MPSSAGVLLSWNAPPRWDGRLYSHVATLTVNRIYDLDSRASSTGKDQERVVLFYR